MSLPPCLPLPRETSPILFLSGPILRRRPPLAPLRYSAALRLRLRRFPAAAVGGEVAPAAAEDRREGYDWREEWYPLYLSAEVPADAPLGLSVFHEQLVLFRDGEGVVRCFGDRCPHRFLLIVGRRVSSSFDHHPLRFRFFIRLAKLSEGQVVDGRLECLYHGWQFGEDGKCLKIPQLPPGAKIPRSACAKTYEVRDSQGVVWVWMSGKSAPNADKLPWFEHYERPGFQDVSTIHDLPYDHSILLENLMDPAHVPISHDRTDFYSKREDAQPILFEVTERTSRGFSGKWSKSRGEVLTNFLSFEAPCVLQNSNEYVDKDGKKQYVSSLFLSRPTGQGRSMIIIRFGTTMSSPIVKLFPKWYFHQNISKVFEQDMGFLTSQNQVLVKEKAPTGSLYLNISSCDTWVAEYRRWKDKVGHGMPYYFGHSTVSLAEALAVVEHSPAGIAAGISASMPAKGGIGDVYAPNPINRYFRHVVHCKECRSVVRSFRLWKNVLVVLAFASVSMAILVPQKHWKVLLLVSASLFSTGAYGCHSALSLVMTNFIRIHRRL